MMDFVCSTVNTPTIRSLIKILRFQPTQGVILPKKYFRHFRKENFWIGAYFSKPDWHSDYYWWKQFPPSDRNANYSIQKYPEQWKKFVDFTHNQINELVSDYGKVDILWLDGGWVRKKTDEEMKRCLIGNIRRQSLGPQSAKPGY